MDVVDAIGSILEDRRRYQDVFRRYRAITQELETLKARQAAWQKESDYKQFLYDELTQAAFQSDEIEQAEERLKTLTHAGRILSVLQHCSTALEEGEQPVNPEIKRLVQQLQAISDLLPGSAPLQERISSVQAEIRDIASDLQSLQDKIDLNPALADELQTRIDLGYRLCKKA